MDLNIPSYFSTKVYKQQVEITSFEEYGILNDIMSNHVRDWRPVKPVLQ